MSGTGRFQPGDNPYQILGLTAQASDAEITRTYRRLVRQHHPDTAPGHTSLDQRRLTQIIAAYQQLRRNRTTASVTAPTGRDVPVSVHHTAATPRPARRPRDPGDIWLDPAPRKDDRSDRRPIPIAHRGRDTAAAVTVTESQAQTGAVVTVAAPEDPIEGRLHNIRVPIPPGTRDGQTLRIAGHGSPGSNGGPPGDLLLTVYLATSNTP